jgi:hypothetical protein
VLGDFLNNKNDSGLHDIKETLNIRAGAIEGLKMLANFFQLVIFSRESIEDGWASASGSQSVPFNEQNKMIKSFLLSHPDIRIDGYYTSLVPVKAQSMWEDYSQIYQDFGLNNEAKFKHRVLFVTAVCN